MSRVRLEEQEIIVSLDPDDFEEEFVVSINPDDFEEEFVVSLNPDDFEPLVVLERFHPNECEPFSSTERKNSRIRNCHPIIPNVLEYIAARRNRTMTEVGLVAFYIGKDLLRSEPSLKRVERARERILRATGNMDEAAKVRYRRALDQFAFDMRTDQGISFQIRLFEAHLKEVNRLGRLLGSEMVPKVRQLVFMAGLIHSRYIGAKDQAEMMAILRRFIVELRQWAADLGEIAELVRSMPVGCRSSPVSNSWDQIVKP
jgi:hypothetical protein